MPLPCEGSCDASWCDRTRSRGRAADPGARVPRRAADRVRSSRRCGRGAGEHAGGVRSRGRAWLPVPGDRRPRDARRGARGVPRRSPGPRHRSGRRDRRSGDRRGRSGGRRPPVLGRRWTHVPVPWSRRAGAAPRGAALELARVPRQHRSEGGRVRAAAGRPTRSPRCLGASVRGLVLRSPPQLDSPARTGPGLHVDGTSCGDRGTSDRGCRLDAAAGCRLRPGAVTARANPDRHQAVRARRPRAGSRSTCLPSTTSRR